MIDFQRCFAFLIPPLFLLKTLSLQAQITTQSTTAVPITAVPTTDVPTTDAPTTDAPTTDAPTTDAPTTDVPTTAVPTTAVATTAAPTTDVPTTDVPSTDVPTTDVPTTDVPTTDVPSTAVPSTDVPITAVPTTAAPTTAVPITAVATTAAPTTDVPTTDVPTTDVPSTDVPTTDVPSTAVPSTAVPTTDVPSTDVPITAVPTTDVPSTAVPTTDVPTTDVPTTDVPTTDVPTTDVPTTDVPTTDVPSTDVPITAVPTTAAPTTAVPTTGAPTTDVPTTDVPTTYSPASPPLRVPCDSLKGQTTGVYQRLNQYSNLVRGRQCIVLSTNSSENLSKLLNEVPKNTVILLSSETASGATLSPSVITPSSGKIPVVYLIDSEIVLKDGQDIIGAPNEGYEIVISPDATYTDLYMIKFGSFNYFSFNETKDSHIRHITFQPTAPNGRKPIGPIITARCINRRLIVENNVFNLNCQTGVRIDCRLPLNASVNDLHQGPALMFTNNRVTADTIESWGGDYIPDGGLFIKLPAIKNQSKRIAVNGNTFQGNMGWVAELHIGPGSSIDIFRNMVDIDNAGEILWEIVSPVFKKEKFGFSLVGHSDTNEEPPVYNLVGNQIRVKNTALDIKGIVQLALACNHFQAVKLWRQEQHEYSIKTTDPLSLVGNCERFTNSSMATVGPTTLSEIVNIWTPIENSTASALSGLTNLEGQFYFNSSVCLTVNLSPVTPSGQASTSSADTKVMTTLLGAMTSLTVDLSSVTPSGQGSTSSAGVMTTLLDAMTSLTVNSSSVSPFNNASTSSAGTKVMTTMLGVMTNLTVNSSSVTPFYQSSTSSEGTKVTSTVLDVMTSLPTTGAPTTDVPTTAVPSTDVATTAVPTTDVPTPTIAAPTTDVPTTAVPTTAVPTTAAPATAVPTTAVPTTAVSTTDVPITAVPTTGAPTTDVPSTDVPSTDVPITAVPTTDVPTTAAPTTDVPITAVPITAVPTTGAPTTDVPSTAVASTAVASTDVPTTAVPTTAVPTTAVPTTAAPTTAVPITDVPTTAVSITAAPTTAVPTTDVPITAVPTTAVPATDVPTTAAPTTDVPTTYSPASPPLRVPCDSLKGQTTGVHQRLNDYKDLVSGRQCIVLSTNSSENLGKFINEVPKNTVILLSSETASGATLSPSVITPSSGKIPVVYLIDSEIVLKDGQDIIGAPNEGYEIVISPDESYTDSYMITFGSLKYFSFDETMDSRIRHITFQPTAPNGRNPIGIITVRCINRRLFVEDNVFNLNCQNGVRIDCRLPLDASVDFRHQGPSLIFANNMVTGDTIESWRRDCIPNGGLFVKLPAINKRFMAIGVYGNKFQGKMGWVAELHIGPGSSIDISGNEIDIDNAGEILFETVSPGYKKEKFGFSLVGHSDTSEEPPFYVLVGNQIRVKNTALDIKGIVDLALTCNHFQAVKLWRQEQHEYSIKSTDPLVWAYNCESFVNPGNATTGPLTFSQHVNIALNTWTPIENSTTSALSGLTNYEGQFFFNSSDCLYFPTPIENSTATALIGMANFEGQFYFNSSACPTVYSSSVTPSGQASTSSAGVMTTLLDAMTSLTVNSSSVSPFDNTSTSSAGTKVMTTMLGAMTDLTVDSSAVAPFNQSSISSEGTKVTSTVLDVMTSLTLILSLYLNIPPT